MKHPGKNRTLLLLVFFLLIFTTPSFSQGGIDGFFSVKDQKITIELIFTKPFPTSGILAVDLPTGNEMVSARPDPSNVSKDKTLVKWLISPITSQKLAVDVTLGRPISDPAKIKVKFQFKESSSGQIKEMKLKYKGTTGG